MSSYYQSAKRSTTPHYGPRNTLRRNDAKEREVQMKADTERAYELLCQLKDRVETSLQPQLEEALAERDELALEVDRLEVENDELVAKLNGAEEKILGLSAESRQHTGILTERMDKIVAEQNGRIEAERRANQLDLRRKDDEIEQLKTRLKQIEGDEPVDLKARSRILELEKALRERDSDMKRATTEVLEVQRRLEETEHRAVEVAPVVTALAKALSELRLFIDEAAGQTGNFVAAISRAGLEGSGGSTGAETDMSNSWSSLQSTAARMKEGAPVQSILEDMHVLLVGMRSAARQEGSLIAHALKKLVLRQQEASDMLAKKDHERQLERDLARRRLDEVERDRQEEREMLLKEIEKEKMKLALQGGGAINASGGGSPPGSPSRRHGSRVVTVSSSTQTSVDLLDPAQSGFSESTLVARLRNELKSVNAQLIEVRQTVKLMERQRQKFIAFVGTDGDERGGANSIPSLVQHALGGPSVDFSMSAPMFALPPGSTMF